MSQLKNKYLVLFLLSYVFTGAYDATGQINAPKTECLRNITSFSYTPPSGLTLGSAKWTFGDGSSSNSLSPKAIYKSTGYFTVKIQAIFTNNSTLTDSMVIRVVGLPKAYYSYLPKSDSCFSNNNICYKDTSRPAAVNQGIVKRLFIWGDGNFNSSTYPVYGDQLCHTYKTPDKYLIKMEVTDIYGCKSSQSSYINIIEQTNADFNIINNFKNCTTRQICITNNSSGKNIKTASYVWTTNNSATDTNTYLGAWKCTDFKSNQSFTTKLKVRDKNGCMDSIVKLYNVYLDSLPDKITLKDTEVCYSSGVLNFASIKSVQNDQIIWNLDQQSVTFTGSGTFQFNARAQGLLPGQHTVNCRIIRGNCTTTLSRNFFINGPVAGIKILDNNQCFSNRQIFFIDDSKYIDSKNAVYKWTVIDPDADTCTIHRAKNINNYTNCNYALDWYTKHQYKNPKPKNPVKLWIRDTVSGCTDTTSGYVNLKVCSPLLNGSPNLCPGEMFTNNPLPTDPKYVSLDKGKTWKKFPMYLDPNLSGKFDVGFIFETVLSEWAETIGKDSIRIRKDTVRFYDTVFMKDYLDLQPFKKDSVTFKIYGKCSPFRVSVHLRDGVFYDGEKLNISWGDGNIYNQGFNNTSKVDSVFHTYSGTGFDGSVKVSLVNRKGCETNTYFTVKVGKKLLVKNVNAYYCKADVPICLAPSIYDVANQVYLSAAQPGLTVEWKFSDSSASTRQFAPCHLFKSKGDNSYKMIVSDAIGCVDSITSSLFIQDLKANVKNTSREIFCSELKQFFDSSSLIPSGYDNITQYVWDFGTGTFTNPQKDPFKSLNTSAEFVHVTHAVKTTKGCVDTIRFDLKIRGSHPYFRIKDTIGCDSLNAVFFNLSKNCKGYIWEFGDAGQSSFSTNNKQNTSFNYLKPGRYFIRLNGYDSIYNPSTNATYYCNSIFPDPLFHRDSVRSVLVLPRRLTGISSPDTICLGTKLDFISLSEPQYDYDLWQLGKDAPVSKDPGNSISHQYLQTGTYVVSLKPGYANATYNICRDSALKTITVLGIKADFDIDANYKAPIFLFHNKSTPAYALLKWDFGQPAGGPYNYSSVNDPMHNYGFDTGSFAVCLRASLPFGCADTICKNLYNDYLSELMVFNVFTPGNIDDKNDQYDVMIEGENLYHLRIYDRWGILVYEGNEDADNTQKKNWNGRVMNTGNECPAGTYYYIFDYALKVNPEKTNTLNGTITLIR